MTNIFCPHRLESLPESCSRSVTFYVPLFGNPALHYRIQSGTPLLHIQARLIQPIIPLSTWIPKVYYHIRKASLLVPILSQINPAHNCPPYVDPKGIYNAPLLVPILSQINLAHNSPPYVDPKGIHNAPLLVPILSQINPAHNSPPYVDPKGIHNAQLLVPILSQINLAHNSPPYVDPKGIHNAPLLVPILSQINPAHNCPPYVDPKGIHNAPLLVPILSHIHPVRLFLTRLFKIHFNIILPSTDGCSKLSSNAKHRNHGRDLRLFFPSVQSVP